MARILIGVSGGIAAYKSIELARLATLAGHGVRVVMTPAATPLRRRRHLRGDHRRAGAASTSSSATPPAAPIPASRRPSTRRSRTSRWPRAPTRAWSRPPRRTRSPSSPAGICDSMLTTSFLAATAPRLIAPAMNDRMWEDAATRANVATLRERGVEVLEPGEGALASRGEHGAGRLQRAGRDPRRARGRARPAAAGPWDGLRVLVTAGGTREAIDPVRFIGNRSSGRMGVALAAAAARRGAAVTLVAANVARPDPAGVERVDVESAAELARAAAEAFAEARRPADGRRGRRLPARGERRGQARPRGLRRARPASSSRPRTCSPALAGRRRGDQTPGRLRRRARRRLRRARPRQARAQGPRRDRRQRRLRPLDRLRLRRQRGDDRRRATEAEAMPRGTKDEIAEAILDRVEALRGVPPAQGEERTSRTPTS